MQPTRSPWLLALILSSILITPVAARAADGPAPGAPPSGHMNRFQQRLGLTDEQMTAIREVHARHAESHKQLRQSLRQAQSDLRQLALNGGDPAAIQSKKSEVAQLLTQALEMRIQSLQEIAPILSPDQRAKLAQMGPRGFGHHGGYQKQGS